VYSFGGERGYGRKISSQLRRSDLMASTNKTTNLGLSQWEGTDAFTREDLNADLGKIDTALAYLPVKLLDVTLTEATQLVQLDLSDIDIDQYQELILYYNYNQEYICMRANGVSNNVYLFTNSDGSNYENYMILQPGLSRMSITKGKYVNCNETQVRINTLSRTHFPRLNTLEIYGIDGGPLLEAGDRFSIWGVNR